MAPQRKGRNATPELRNPPGAGSWHETRTGWRYRGITGRTAGGKAITHDSYGRTKEEALVKFEAYKAAHPNGPPSLDAQQALEPFMTVWLRTEVRRRNEVSTWESYTDTTALHIVPRIGARRLCDLTRPIIQAWVNEMEADKVGTATIKYAYAILRRALNYAIECEILEKNPALKVRLPDHKPRKAVALTLAQVKALLAAAGGRLDVRKPFKRKNGRPMTPIKVSTRYFVLYLFYILLGTRRGELLALRWSDVNFETGAVQIERSLDKRRRERGTKTDDSERLLYLDELALAALEAHRRAMRKEGHEAADDPEGLVFISEKGTPIIPDNLRRHFRLVLAAAGLPLTIRIHDLRHTAASLMLARGNEPINVSKLLGHSNQTTTGIYSHAYEEGKRKAIASISGIILDNADQLTLEGAERVLKSENVEG